MYMGLFKQVFWILRWRRMNIAMKPHNHPLWKLLSAKIVEKEADFGKRGIREAITIRKIWLLSRTISWFWHLVPRPCILTVSTCYFPPPIPSTSNAHPLAISAINYCPLYLKLSHLLPQILALSISTSYSLYLKHLSFLQIQYMWTRQNMHRWIKTILVCFNEKYNFDNNFDNFSLNMTTFGMSIDNIDIDMFHDCGCYGNHFGRKLRIPYLP